MSTLTTSQNVVVVYDALSFIAGLEVFMGNPSQTYNCVTGTYEPSRISPFKPCVIYPTLSVSDPDGTKTSSAIADVKYYLGVPLEGDANLIGNGDGYTRVTEEQKVENDPPKWSLIVAKNFKPEEPAEIYAVISFVDHRNSRQINVTRSVVFSTSAYQPKSMSLELDKPAVNIINPIDVSDWKRSIKATLRENGMVVPPEESYYTWMIKENNSAEWREITADELDICVSGKNADGRWGDTLTFDARFFRLVSFRAIAQRYKGTYPTKPGTEAIMQDTTFKVAYPDNLTFDVLQLSGAKIKSDMTTNVTFACLIGDSRGPIPDAKYDLFQITWKAVSAKPDTAGQTIGVGRQIAFKPNTLGFDKGYGISVYAEIKMRVVTTLVTQGGKVIVSGGKAVTADKYE